MINQIVDKEQRDIIKWQSVSADKLLKKGTRLEAYFYLGDKLGSEVANQVPLGSLLEYCAYPGRFKRIYSNGTFGEPFYLPSQISEVYPKPSKYIDKNQVTSGKGSLKVSKGELIITRSGTIGNITYVTNTLDGGVFSDDVIRMKPIDDKNLGFIYIYLKSKDGRKKLQTNNYGAVVNHIEPEHLESLAIPVPSNDIKKQINSLVIDSFKLRDESNLMIDKAHELLRKSLHLPRISELAPKYFSNNRDVATFTVASTELNGRLEAVFHSPLVTLITDLLFKSAREVVKLNNPRISKAITLPGRFKRVYVEPEFGIPFLGGKEILELDPRGEKFLSFDQHERRITEQLTLKKDMVLVTCSGTIGKVTIVPEFWDGWAASQHLLRVIPASTSVAGYVFAWLSSEYGKVLISSSKYGAVVDELNDKQLSQISIPIIDSQAMKKINNLVIGANNKRTEAYTKEQEAFKVLNDKVLGLVK